MPLLYAEYKQTYTTLFVSVKKIPFVHCHLL